VHVLAPAGRPRHVPGGVDDHVTDRCGPALVSTHAAQRAVARSGRENQLCSRRCTRFPDQVVGHALPAVRRRPPVADRLGVGVRVERRRRPPAHFAQSRGGMRSASGGKTPAPSWPAGRLLGTSPVTVISARLTMSSSTSTMPRRPAHPARVPLHQGHEHPRAAHRALTPPAPRRPPHVAGRNTARPPRPTGRACRDLFTTDYTSARRRATGRARCSTRRATARTGTASPGARCCSHTSSRTRCRRTAPRHAVAEAAPAARQAIGIRAPTML